MLAITRPMDEKIRRMAFLGRWPRSGPDGHTISCRGAGFGPTLSEDEHAPF
jgi:hypothetical protein